MTAKKPAPYRPPGYISWSGMIQRCHNSKNKHYKHYGGRGIKVCDRWRYSSKTFLEDMGPPPSPNHTIERENTNGDYEPDNCIWLLKNLQNRNTRRSRLLTLKGKTACVVDWSETLGLPAQCIFGRLKSGWTIEEALTTPNGQTRDCRVVFQGKAVRVSELSKRFGISRTNILKRLRRGWSVKRAIETPLGYSREKLG